MFDRLYLENEALVAMDAHLGTCRDGLGSPDRDGSPAISVHGYTSTSVSGEDLLADEDPTTDEGIHAGLGIV